LGYGGVAGNQLYALRGVTNELVDVTRFEIGYNLALGSDGQLLVGGFRSSPGILDAATLELVTRLSGIPAGDEFAYVAMMPVPEPSELAAVGALLALLAVRLSRPYP
jgi:hypothetical protein